MNTTKSTNTNKRPGENFLGTYLGVFGKSYPTDGVLDLADHLDSQALILVAQAEETRPVCAEAIDQARGLGTPTATLWNERCVPVGTTHG